MFLLNMMNVDPMSWWLVFLHVLHSLPVIIIILIGARADSNEIDCRVCACLAEFFMA